MDGEPIDDLGSLNISSCKRSTDADAREGERGGLIISEFELRRGTGTFIRLMLDVGDSIGRGDAGGDNGTAPELEPVKNGSGAAETSSSSV